MLYLGFSGFSGAGKTTACKYLESKGFVFLSLSDLVRKIARELGLELTRENLINLGNKLRREKGEGYLAELICEEIEKRGIEKACIDSIRHPAEALTLKKRLKNFYLIWIETDMSLRYERVRKVTNISYDEFVRYFEMEHDNISRVKELADFIIYNNGSIEELYKQLDNILKNLIK